MNTPNNKQSKQDTGKRNFRDNRIKPDSREGQLKRPPSPKGSYSYNRSAANKNHYRAMQNKLKTEQSERKYSTSQNQKPLHNKTGGNINKKSYSVLELIQQLPLLFKVNYEFVIKTVISTLLVIFFALLQTTVFARFKPFGAIPELMLVLTIAIAVSEDEKTGAVFGLISAVVISSISGKNTVWLPLFYVPTGYICGYLSTYRFTRSIAVRFVYTLSACILRSVLTAAEAMKALKGATVLSVIEKILVPELLSTLILALPVHVIAWLCLRHFHKTRAEMIQNTKKH